MTLRFARSCERASPVAGEKSALHVWRNRRNGVVATGYRADGFLWMHWTCLALYRFSRDSDEIVAFPEPTGPAAVIWDTYRRSVLPMALQARGLEAFHASAVVSHAGIVAFCATSETGKSTVAYGLRRRGIPQWADDAVVFQGDGRHITTMPLPFEVRLREESQKLFGDWAPRSAGFSTDGPGEQIHFEPARIAAICLLSRIEPEPADVARIRRITPAEAFHTLLLHAHVFDPKDAARRQRTLHSYLNLVGAVPVYEVAFAPVAEQLDSLLGAIEKTFELGPTHEAMIGGRP
jgi:hypothetical protein